MRNGRSQNNQGPGDRLPTDSVLVRPGLDDGAMPLASLARSGALDPEDSPPPTPDELADALFEARVYAEAIVNSVREPLIVLDEDLRIRSVNEPFTTLFLHTAPEAIGRRLHELDGGVWDVATLASRLLDVLARGLPMQETELSFDSVGLGPRNLRLTARRLHRGGGRPNLILLAIDDVTDRRLVEKLLREGDERIRQEENIRRRQLELSNASRLSTVGELAAGLAHELNQPLSAISNTVEACVQVLRSGTAGPAKLLQLLGEVAAASTRAADIVAHLRSFVDKGEADLQRIDLGEIVRHVPHLLHHDLQAMSIDFRLRQPASAMRILGDRIQIEQVIVNLVQNAMDSIREAERPQRLIDIRVRALRGFAEVRVRDTGTGVVAAAAERIFDPFYTTKGAGLGMGLALSKSIMEAHRGRIWHEAPAGGGAGSVIGFAIPLLPNQPSSRREAA
jgi:two-component system sensor kinase FixL